MKYFKNITDFEDFELKLFIYCFFEEKDLINTNEMIFLSEAIPNKQEEFINAIEIQN